ncbi:FXSXX-COOH protein [Actinomadura sp. LD22]|uniref:FXSXX-COOH protein n=1 Tax=Actinomadura physcomitrii TaxID=2650748 RepID=A0A6I4MUN4_9ACTN|nr:FxSxx-COOH cyclophane-containing RiPP peptide [Actinomadura physcomitrii]MWA06349.1 FXSXX-COOH protein [Actinomadura physcomitrii]
MQRTGDVREGLPDVSDLTLGDLGDLDSSVLALAVRELLEPGRRDGEPVAGFQSYTDDPA